MSANSNSFHSSPQEALAAPAEESYYVACLHEGTGVTRRTSSPWLTPRRGTFTRRRCRT